MEGFGRGGISTDGARLVEVSASLPSSSGIRDGVAWTMVQMRVVENRMEEMNKTGEAKAGDMNVAGGVSGAFDLNGERHTSQSHQGTVNPQPLIPNLNTSVRPLALSNSNLGERSDNLSLSLDLEGGSEGGSIRRRKEHVPAHLAPMVREWLREQRENNGYLPNSPLRPRSLRDYDGRSGGPSRARGARFSPYHSVERLIEMPSPELDLDPLPKTLHETSNP